MEILPDPLICLTLQHIIDQSYAVEALMSEHTSAVEKCLPFALKEVYGLPVIPDAKTTVGYLITLWKYTGISQYSSAAQYGLTRLLPFIFPNPQEGIIRGAIGYALEGRHPDTVKYLLSLSNAKNITSRDMQEIVRKVLHKTLKDGNLESVQYLLSLPSAKPIISDNMKELLAIAIHSSSPQVIQYILSLPRANETIRDRITELYLFALRTGESSAVEVLLNLNSTPEVLSSTIATALSHIGRHDNYMPIAFISVWPNFKLRTTVKVIPLLLDRLSKQVPRDEYRSMVEMFMKYAQHYKLAGAEKLLRKYL